MSTTTSENTATAPAIAAAPPKPTAKPKPGSDAHKQLQPLCSYAGTMGAFAANPDGVLDRFQLETAGQAYTVKFPSHFGQELQALAEMGSEVAVLGFVEKTPRGMSTCTWRASARPAPAPAPRRPLPPARAKRPPSTGPWPS